MITVSKFLILRCLIVGAALALFAASGAEASTVTSSSTSTNWAGYVAHGSGANFRYVSAVWKQPTATCTPGNPTYSAFWVGLGGYSLNSQALEQIGTEVDCSPSGRAVSTAWYELVPAPSTGIRMIVNQGDVLAGSVTVIGHRVTLTLSDRTRDKKFSKTLTVPSVDVTSADWIVEAPSECNGNGNNCQALPLADFGAATFTHAKADTISKRIGSISSNLWDTAVITLAPGGHQYASYQDAAGGEATPSPLESSGGAFSVAYSTVTPVIGQPQPGQPPGQPPTEAKLSSRAGAEVQPGGVRR